MKVKFRIIQVEQENGSSFHIQRRKWFFWVYYSYETGYPGNYVMHSFRDIMEAIDWLKDHVDQKPGRRKLIQYPTIIYHR